MNTFLPTLLSFLQDYGYPALWLTIFIASIGIPLPVSLLLLGAGAFAALGDFNLVLLVLIAASASVCGDNVGYWLGRSIGGKVFDWLERKKRFISPRLIVRSRVYFQKRGAWAVFLSRFLFSALGSPVNLIAGAERYSYRRFLIYDTLGELLGALTPLALGYVFGAGWESIGDLLGTTSLLVLALLFTCYLIYHLIQLARHTQKQRASIIDPSTKFRSGVLAITKEEPDSLPL